MNLEQFNSQNPPPPSSPGPLISPRSGEPKTPILVNHEEDRVVNECIEILARQPNIYKKANSLVRLFRNTESNEETPGTIRFKGTPRIWEIKPGKLRTLLVEFADWFRETRNAEKDDFELKPIHPPDWAITGVHSHGEWPGVPEVNAIVECPIIRRDGSILASKGFDRATGVIFEPNDKFLDVPETVSLDEAREVLSDLADIVDQFPFATIKGNPRTYKAAWLAALLTPFARFAIDGPCPLFLFDANAAGSGKSLLCDIISIIITGRNMTRSTYPSTDEEMRKRITSHALSSDFLVMIDNIATQFGGAALDAVLTSTVWKDRILGKSEMSPELPMFTVWYATGNNIFLKGDIQRRIIPCSLDCDEEKPQEREFRHEDLPAYVAANRAKLIRSCLMVLRGFIQAGKPRGVRLPMGSYEQWSDLVRSCVFWATGEDCLVAQDQYRTLHDSQNELKESLLSGLAEFPGARSEKGVTASAVLTQMANLIEIKSNAYPTLREALLEMSGGNGLPSIKQLGNKLKSINNCRVGDLKLVCVRNTATSKNAWRILDRNFSPDTPKFDEEQPTLKEFDDAIVPRE